MKCFIQVYSSVKKCVTCWVNPKNSQSGSLKIIFQHCSSPETIHIYFQVRRCNPYISKVGSLYKATYNYISGVALEKSKVFDKKTKQK